MKIRQDGGEYTLPPYPFHLALFVQEAWAIVYCPLHWFRPSFSRSVADYGSRKNNIATKFPKLTLSKIFVSLPLSVYNESTV